MDLDTLPFLACTPQCVRPFFMWNLWEILRLWCTKDDKNGFSEAKAIRLSMRHKTSFYRWYLFYVVMEVQHNSEMKFSHLLVRVVLSLWNRATQTANSSVLREMELNAFVATTCNILNVTISEYIKSIYEISPMFLLIKLLRILSFLLYWDDLTTEFHIPKEQGQSFVFQALHVL